MLPEIKPPPMSLASDTETSTGERLKPGAGQSRNLSSEHPLTSEHTGTIPYPYDRFGSAAWAASAKDCSRASSAAFFSRSVCCLAMTRRKKSTLPVPLRVPWLRSLSARVPQCHHRGFSAVCTPQMKTDDTHLCGCVQRTKFSIWNRSDEDTPRGRNAPLPLVMTWS